MELPKSLPPRPFLPEVEVLQASEIMRSGNGFPKLATSFFRNANTQSNNRNNFAIGTNTSAAAVPIASLPQVPQSGVPKCQRAFCGRPPHNGLIPALPVVLPSSAPLYPPVMPQQQNSQTLTTVKGFPVCAASQQPHQCLANRFPHSSSSTTPILLPSERVNVSSLIFLTSPSVYLSPHPHCPKRFHPRPLQQTITPLNCAAAQNVNPPLSKQRSMPTALGCPRAYIHLCPCKTIRRNEVGTRQNSSVSQIHSPSYPPSPESSGSWCIHTLAEEGVTGGDHSSNKTPNNTLPGDSSSRPLDLPYAMNLSPSNIPEVGHAVPTDRRQPSNSRQAAVISGGANKSPVRSNINMDNDANRNVKSAQAKIHNSGEYSGTIVKQGHVDRDLEEGNIFPSSSISSSVTSLASSSSISKASRRPKSSASGDSLSKCKLQWLSCVSELRSLLFHHPTSPRVNVMRKAVTEGATVREVFEVGTMTF